MFTGNLREATRSVHVSYPIPFMAALLLASGLTMAGLAVAASGWLAKLLAGLACILVFAAIGFMVLAVAFRPSLLRSEHFVFLDRMMDEFGDREMDPGARERLHGLMITSFAEKHSRLPSVYARLEGTKEEDQ